MEPQTMGRVLVTATIDNLKDLWAVERGLIPADKARQITVSNALVDTGATTLALPTQRIEQLGLTKSYEKRATSTQSPGIVAVYEAVRLTIQGRTCVVEVMEVPNEVPPLIGQIPLEMLDLVVDLRSQQLTGNPAHGGEHVLELY